MRWSLSSKEAPARDAQPARRVCRSSARSGPSANAPAICSPIQPQRCVSGRLGRGNISDNGDQQTCHSRPPALAGGSFRMCVKNRPPRKPQDQRSHPTPGLDTPRKFLRSTADRARSPRDPPLQILRKFFPAKPARVRVRGSPMASELQSSVHPQSGRKRRGLACSSQGATPVSPSRRSVAPSGPLLAESPSASL